MGELSSIASPDEATTWASKAIAAKNTLQVPDAEAVETAFERRLIELSEGAVAGADVPTFQGQGSDADGPKGQPQPGSPSGTGDAQASLPAVAAAVSQSEVISHKSPAGVDKSVLTLSEPKRHRNKEHLRFVGQQPFLICGRTPSDPHHLRFAHARALGRKVSDEFVVPLCRTHHRPLHRVGNERGWWAASGIDPLEVAGMLWGMTRLIEQPEPVTAQTPTKPIPVAPEPPCGSPSEPGRRRRGRPKKNPVVIPIDGGAP